jgi:DNA helicase INO80
LSDLILISPSSDPDFAINTTLPFGRINNPVLSPYLERAVLLPSLGDISLDFWERSVLSRQDVVCFAERAAAPPIRMYSADRSFLESQAQFYDSPMETLALYGLPPPSCDLEDPYDRLQSLLPGIPPTGLIGASPRYELPSSPMHIPEVKRLIFDSAKLARLDTLLQELKAGGHKVLIYFQMTKMIDLMEEYLAHRQYKYLRLDGMSRLEDRRDMVIDWQTRCVWYI